MKRPKVVKLKRTPKQAISHFVKVQRLINRFLLKTDLTIAESLFQPNPIHQKLLSAIDRAKTALEHEKIHRP